MAILIYPYSNPYKINSEPYWAMIKNSFHLCVSQTLVNGLCDQYAEFYKGKLTTINRFINVLYDNWNSDVVAIKQRADIDNIISYLDFDSVTNGLSSNNVITSLKRNRKHVLDSIRIMFELNMVPNNMKKDELTIEQKCVLMIYEELINSNNKHFNLLDPSSESIIDEAIDHTIEEAMRANDNKVGENKIHEALEQIGKKTIVVHGIHQFTPIMLRTIEELSKYKTIVILFNYQVDYKNAYQTWLNVYEWFESKIQLPKQNFFAHSTDYEGNILADNMAALLSGNNVTNRIQPDIDVLEFDNQTEFAGYISLKFEEAQKKRAEDSFAHPTLFYMDEQIYSANSDVNDILRIYFPEQFDEYDFLEYPIGHFFISVTNMWDPDTSGMNIRDMNDVRECLSCGIIVESKAGLIISLFDKCQLFFSKETTIEGIIRQLYRLKKKLKGVIDTDDDSYDLRRIEYFDVSDEEIDTLIFALKELNELVEQFFCDFNEEQNDFKKFYNKIADVLKTKVLERDELADDFRDIVARVLDRLDSIKDTEASASFDCLRETMQLYLLQTSKEGNGANWIVRNFEQIDGDVLRSTSMKDQKTYHFACLSDQDMTISHRDEFPWPLDIDFFEIAQAPVDWKYQVYVTSRLEYRNFKRYALIYGLAFSKCRIKLSYIRNKNDEQCDLYYLLSVLGIKKQAYIPGEVNGIKTKSDHIRIELSSNKQFDKYDLIKYRLCQYRFLLESVIEGNSIYKDDFLIKNYLTIVLENRVRKQYSGKTYIPNVIRTFLNDQVEELSSSFPFVNGLDTVDAVNHAIKYIEKHVVYKGMISPANNQNIDYMNKLESFLFVPSQNSNNSYLSEAFKNSTQAEVDELLSDDALNESSFRTTLNSICDKCSEKDICLEVYKVKRGK